MTFQVLLKYFILLFIGLNKIENFILLEKSIKSTIIGTSSFVVSFYGIYLMRWNIIYFIFLYKVLKIEFELSFSVQS